MRKDIKTGLITGAALSLIVALVFSLIPKFSLESEQMRSYENKSDNTTPKNIHNPNPDANNSSNKAKVGITEIAVPANSVADIGNTENSNSKTLGEIVRQLDTAENKTQVSTKEVKKAKQTHYTVEAGDTLHSISNKFYGTSIYWEKIYLANKPLIDNVNNIKSGTDIVIPD